MDNYPAPEFLDEMALLREHELLRQNLLTSFVSDFGSDEGDPSA